jgi:hypothetical protein
MMVFGGNTESKERSRIRAEDMRSARREIVNRPLWVIRHPSPDAKVDPMKRREFAGRSGNPAGVRDQMSMVDFVR